MNSARNFGNILSELNVYVCDLDASLRIVPGGYSDSLPELLNIDNTGLDGKNILEILKDFGEVSTEELTLTKSSLEMILDHEYWVYTLNCENLVDKVKINHKVLSLKWVPQLDENTEKINSYLLTLIDKTTEEQFAKKALEEEEKRKKSLEIVSQLLTIPPSRVIGFFQDVNNRLDEIMDLLEEGELDSEKIFIHLHTIKGSARLYNLSYISEAAHEAESTFQVLRDTNKIDKEVAESQIDAIHLEVFSHEYIANNILNNEVSQHAGLMGLVEEQKPFVMDLIEKNSLKFGSFGCIDAVPVWTRDQLNLLKSIFVHAFANSIDHGFILQKSSSNSVEITTHAFVEEDRISITIKDNGAGINLEKIKSKMRSKGVSNADIDDKIAYATLFEDEFSTAEKVTINSGRGTGLSAVHHLVREFGGDVSIRNNEGDGVLLTIKIPKSDDNRA